MLRLGLSVALVIAIVACGGDKGQAADRVLRNTTAGVTTTLTLHGNGTFDLGDSNGRSTNGTWTQSGQSYTLSGRNVDTGQNETLVLTMGSNGCLTYSVTGDSFCP